MISKYSHTTRAVGGFWTADINVSVPSSEISEWVESGLGAHVEARNAAGDLFWVGLIDSVILNVGDTQITIGSVLGIKNKLRLSYSTFVEGEQGQMQGTTQLTDWVEDIESQRRYGTQEDTLSVSGIAADNISTALALSLDKHSEPHPKLSLQAFSGKHNLTIKCIGYSQMLTKYVYRSTTTTGTTASSKIAAILSDDPNGLVNVASGRFETNDLALSSYANGKHTAWEEIKIILSQGDSNNNRWVFGIYDGRRPEYKALPTGLSYYYQGGQFFDYVTGEVIPPELVRPANRMVVSGILAGRAFDATPATADPRIAIIEQVSFTAPNTITINSGVSFAINQFFAQMGLIGAGG